MEKTDKLMERKNQYLQDEVALSQGGSAGKSIAVDFVQ